MKNGLVLGTDFQKLDLVGGFVENHQGCSYGPGEGPLGVPESLGYFLWSFGPVCKGAFTGPF